jgi:hypothetical protein
MPTRAANWRATWGSGIRRRVHSPSCAIRITVFSVTVVRGSRNASTPYLDRTNSSK